MHFSIPETESLEENNGTPFVAFHIQVNGIHHCKLRYRQLRHLHSILKQEFGSSSLPPFPPRQILKLSEKQIEDRRVLLENYLQSISKNPVIVSSPAFCSFFISAQKETFNDTLERVELTVHLMSREKTVLSVLSIQQSDFVLQKACKQLGIPEEFGDDLSLFVLRKEDNGTFSLLRQLQPFESPYFALKSLPGTVSLVIRKNSWDSMSDSKFLRNEAALDLLYSQTVADFENGWFHATEDQAIKLTLYQGRGDRLKFLELAKTLKHYGYVQFLPCKCDFPEAQSTVIVAAGHKELAFQICNDSGDVIQEWCFKVTRIRCWRITTLSRPSGASSSTDVDPRLELSFEYLMSKENHRWITLRSDQAVLMSLSLQGMVEELVRKSSGFCTEKSQSCRKRAQSWSYIRLDGSRQQVSSSSSSLSFDSSDGPVPARISFKREDSRDRISFGNSVYDGIGDDDL